MKVNLHKLIEENASTLNLSVEELKKILPKEVEALEFIKSQEKFYNPEVSEDINRLKILIQDVIKDTL